MNSLSIFHFSTSVNSLSLHYCSLIYLLDHNYLAAANNTSLFFIYLVADCHVYSKIFVQGIRIFDPQGLTFPIFMLDPFVGTYSNLRTYYFCKWDIKKLKFLISSLWDNFTLPHLELFATKLFVEEFICLFSFKTVYFNIDAQIVFYWLISLFIVFKIFTSNRIAYTLQFIFLFKDNCYFKFQYIYMYLKTVIFCDLLINCFTFHQFKHYFKVWLKGSLCNL